MKINSDELAEYVRAVLEGISKGVSQDIFVDGESEKFSVRGPVKFQVGISNSLEVGGEAKIFVVGFHGGKSMAQQHRVEFEVSTEGAAFLEGIDKIVSIYGKLPQRDQEALKSGLMALATLITTAKQNAPPT